MKLVVVLVQEIPSVELAARVEGISETTTLALLYSAA